MTVFLDSSEIITFNKQYLTTSNVTLPDQILKILNFYLDLKKKYLNIEVLNNLLYFLSFPYES